MEQSQHSDHRVCAIVVTYHPTSQMIDNLTDILAQTQGLVVVDNGSGASAIQRLREAGVNQSFHLIENDANLGLAEALNQGVRWAKNQEFPWVLLFDQDSRITPGFVDQMFTSLELNPQREHIGAMHPKHIDPSTGIEPNVFRASDGGPVISMTSGALMPTWIFDKIGLFSSEYFIDQIDIEYGYRIRAAGYVNADSRKAVLIHSPGHPKDASLMGFSFKPTYHSAGRRYYLTRNRFAVYRKYFRVFPKFILRSAYFDIRETLKCLIAEPDRFRKFRNILLGTYDGIAGRMGRRNSL
ncbi:glycosyltransferase family 2 protein [Acidicapsa dinghuensis]|uniref:Glycosyltransferase family 2 protein n=1 Tax=Acidicapsa dinghuensis TaxID=2218256 RepID=A0ABW1EM80_9BACT|nr:glycosyltransferase family 2 protein [Acidicapsa dinghuensis]